MTDRGRFVAATLHDFDGALTVDLDITPDRGWEDHVGAPAADSEQVKLDWSALPPSGAALDGDQAHDIAQYMAAQLKAKGLRLHASAADIAQSTIARLAAQPGVTEINQPLILRAIGREATNMRNAELGLRHEDVKALNILWPNRVRAQAQLGRTLTRSEYDLMALAVRDQWPNHRHRPRVRFHAATASPHLP